VFVEGASTVWEIKCEDGERYGSFFCHENYGDRKFFSPRGRARVAGGVNATYANMGFKGSRCCAEILYKHTGLIRK